METDILIIGGGLAGLSLARHLEAAGCDWQLVEARDRWGGRILTEEIDGQGFDLGPSWFWPGQERMSKLINQLGLARFDQAYQGDLIYQDETGAIHRGQGMASMQGSWRLQGGLGLLVSSLVATLPRTRLHQGNTVINIARMEIGIKAQLTTGEKIVANKVVLALPPRVAMQLNFTPDLSDKTRNTANNIATWMAGHAKAVAIYNEPFWQQQGLSGDAMSRCGPLVEIHDASPKQGGPYALFGFVGTPASNRSGNTEALKEAISNQLGQLFGNPGFEVERLLLKDWAFDSFTAMDLDHNPPNHHPAYGRPDAMVGLWDGSLHFGATEMGTQYGGYLEGALEAADELAAVLL